MMQFHPITAVQICVIGFALVFTIGGSMLASPHTKIIDVTTFGAVAGDGKDDTHAVLAALEKCRKSSPSTLVFPKGRYDFFSNNNIRQDAVFPVANPLFPVADTDRLTIDGQGSEFIVHNVTGVLKFTNCKNLTVRNLTIDWERPPFSLARVLAVQDNSFDVEVFPEYPVNGTEAVQAFMDYDPVTRLPAHHGLDVYYAVERNELLREQVLRIHLKKKCEIKPGALVLLRHYIYESVAIHCDRCSDVSIKDINLHSVPGMGFVAGICTNVTLERVRVVPKPGSGYPMSAAADATHFAGCKGTIRMDGCVFDGMGDDGVNIKSGLYLSMTRKLDDRTVDAKHNLKMVDAPDPGDVMEISHVEDLLPYARATVKKVELLPEHLHRVEFDKPLPAELREGDVFGNASRAPRVRIRNCQVRNNRARGMLIQTRDVVVEGCTFRNCTGPGILVLTEVVVFFESIGTRDVTIRGNTFEHCNYGAAMGPGVLCSMAYLKDFRYPPKSGVHKNVLFEDNIIRDTDNSGIFVAGTDGITLKGNLIENSCLDPTSDTGKYAIYVMSSRGIRINGNTVEPKKQAKGMIKAMQFGDAVEQSEAMVDGNKGF